MRRAKCKLLVLGQSQCSLAQAQGLSSSPFSKVIPLTVKTLVCFFLSNFGFIRRTRRLVCKNNSARAACKCVDHGLPIRHSDQPTRSRVRRIFEASLTFSYLLIGSLTQRHLFVPLSSEVGGVLKSVGHAVDVQRLIHFSGAFTRIGLHLRQYFHLAGCDVNSCCSYPPLCSFTLSSPAWLTHLFQRRSENRLLIYRAITTRLQLSVFPRFESSRLSLGLHNRSPKIYPCRLIRRDLRLVFSSDFRWTSLFLSHLSHLSSSLPLLCGVIMNPLLLSNFVWRHNIVVA
jgi:hypothetical protein